MTYDQFRSSNRKILAPCAIVSCNRSLAINVERPTCVTKIGIIPNRLCTPLCFVKITRLTDAKHSFEARRLINASPAILTSATIIFYYDLLQKRINAVPFNTIKTVNAICISFVISIGRENVSYKITRAR